MCVELDTEVHLTPHTTLPVCLDAVLDTVCVVQAAAAVSYCNVIISV